MFPGNSLNDLYYPMTADVYYSTETQNDFGEIVKEWNKDRSIKCAARRRNARTNMQPYVEEAKFLEYKVDIVLRTPEDIFLSSEDNVYRITSVLIKDIKDNNGTLLWKESSTEGTVFEVNAIEPILDMFNNLSSYRINLTRSDKQEI